MYTEKAKQSSRRVIIGLGNPTEEYKGTRHNTGFMYIGYLLDKYKDQGIKEKKLKNSIVYEVGEDLILVKPETFMNNSGSAVKEVVKWLNVDSENELILAHDDLDIPLGKFKFQFEKSPKDHNGVRSVEDHLGTTRFYRLRIGVDNRQGKQIEGERYVLERFSEEESVQVREVFDTIGEINF